MKAEIWYCWREYTIAEFEDTPRLLVPWSDPMEYEYAADGIFNTKEQAEAWKNEIAPDEDWVLCEETIEPCGTINDAQRTLLYGILCSLTGGACGGYLAYLFLHCP